MQLLPYYRKNDIHRIVRQKIVRNGTNFERF
jgi:hypothetical protein